MSREVVPVKRQGFYSIFGLSPPKLQLKEYLPYYKAAVGSFDAITRKSLGWLKDLFVFVGGVFDCVTGLRKHYLGSGISNNRKRQNKTT